MVRPYLELGLMMALLNRGLHKMMVEWGGGGVVEHNRLVEGDG